MGKGGIREHELEQQQRLREQQLGLETKKEDQLLPTQSPAKQELVEPQQRTEAEPSEKLPSAQHKKELQPEQRSQEEQEGPSMARGETLEKSLEELVCTLRHTFKSERTLCLDWRMNQLRQLRRGIEECWGEIIHALRVDLGRPELEVYTNEISLVFQEIDYFLNNLSSLMEKEHVVAPMVQMPSLAYRRHQPKGVMLLIAPWNYPFQLVFAPLAGMIATGNCVLIKPSHKSKATRDIITTIVNNYLDNDCFRVVHLHGPQHQALLSQRYDHIFFTGSTSVGRYVYQEASKNLIPVTLELGGKSPCIVDKSASLKVAAKRIIWGKLQNLGQTCIAPDYILVHDDIKTELIAELKNAIRELYGNDLVNNKDYGKIINEKQFNKLQEMMEEAGMRFKVEYGGGSNKELLFFEPTIVTDVQLDAKLMQKEIFGPILPIITFSSLDEAICFVNDRPRSLALYVFAQDDNFVTNVMNRTISGGACINDTFVHIAIPGLPFGGVGESGIGRYHQRYSWDEFSHTKGVFHKATLVDPAMRYPPYSSTKLTLMQWFG